MIWQARTPKNLIEEALDGELKSLALLPQDASKRKYYRIVKASGASTILMELSGSDKELLKRDHYPWTHINHYLAKSNFFTPKILHSFSKHGSLLIEDFGDISLSKKLNSLQGDKKAIARLYDQALATLVAFTEAKPQSFDGWSHRQFDREIFFQELLYFWEHITKLLPRSTTLCSRSFRSEAYQLASSCFSGKMCFTHRDFHARNIFVVNSRLGLIDFQDARWGPIGYDLVSLAFDPYVEIDKKLRLEMLNSYAKELPDASRRGFTEAAVPLIWQRLIKAMGSYAALTLDNKKGYFTSLHSALRLLRAIDPPQGGLPMINTRLLPLLANELSSRGLEAL